jgi:hypothetical protein
MILNDQQLHTSAYEPNPDEVFAAVKAALEGNPRLAELLEEAARQVVVQGYLVRESSLILAVEALRNCQRHLLTCANIRIPLCSRTAGYRASQSVSVSANEPGARYLNMWQSFWPVDAGRE